MVKRRSTSKSKSVKSEKITLTLNPKNPVEGVIIDSWKDKDNQVQVGPGEFVEGVELIRRLILRGYADLRRDFPEALPPPKIQGREMQKNVSSGNADNDPIERQPIKLQPKSGASGHSAERKSAPSIDEFGSRPV